MISTYGMSEIQGSSTNKAQRLLFVYYTTTSFIFSQVFAKDYYHQPSLSNLSVTNAYIYNVYIKKKSKPAAAIIIIHSRTKKTDNLFNQSIYQRSISMRINQIYNQSKEEKKKGELTRSKK